MIILLSTVLSMCVSVNQIMLYPTISDARSLVLPLSDLQLARNSFIKLYFGFQQASLQPIPLLLHLFSEYSYFKYDN